MSGVSLLLNVSNTRETIHMKAYNMEGIIRRSILHLMDQTHGKLKKLMIQLYPCEEVVSDFC